MEELYSTNLAFAGLPAVAIAGAAKVQAIARTQTDFNMFPLHYHTAMRCAPVQTEEWQTKECAALLMERTHHVFAAYFGPF